MVAAGESTRQIAERLGIAENTAKIHLNNIFKKTGSANRVQAARHYLDHYASAASEPTAPPGGKRSKPRAGETSLIRRQKREIQARLDELEAAAVEAEHLRQALDALRAIEPD